MKAKKKKIPILKGNLKYKAAIASLHIKYINNLNKQGAQRWYLQKQTKS